MTGYEEYLLKYLTPQPIHPGLCDPGVVIEKTYARGVLLINGWDAEKGEWGMIPLRCGMRVGHNLDLGSFVVVDVDAQTGLVVVRQADDTGVFPTRQMIEPPLVRYHLASLRKR